MTIKSKRHFCTTNLVYTNLNKLVIPKILSLFFFKSNLIGLRSFLLINMMIENQF